MRELIRHKNPFLVVLTLWPIVALAGILGGIAGLQYASLQPPVYRAAAQFAAGLNFDRDPPLRQREQDLAEGKVATFLRSDSVLADVEKALLDAKLISEGEDFSGDFILERRISDWYFAVYHYDPVIAAFAANAWAEAAQDAFRKARFHALKAELLEAQIERVQIRLLNLQDYGFDSNVGIEGIENLERRERELEEALETELELSHGVESFFSLEWTARASIPTEPVVYGRGRLAIGGAMAGIGLAVVGLMVFSIGRETPITRQGRTDTSSETS